MSICNLHQYWKNVKCVINFYLISFTTLLNQWRIMDGPTQTMIMICRLQSILFTSFLLSGYSNLKEMNINTLPVSVHDNFALLVIIITSICRRRQRLWLWRMLVEWGKRRCSWFLVSIRIFWADMALISHTPIGRERGGDTSHICLFLSIYNAIFCHSYFMNQLQCLLEKSGR